MAKRKRKTTGRRKRRGLSEGMSRKVTRRRRKNGLLSAGAFNASNLMEAGRELVGGGIGGFVGAKVHQMTPSFTPFQKALSFGGAALAAHMFGFKNMGTGIAGAYGFAMGTGVQGMSENDEMQEHDYTDQDALNEMADAMDENGKPLFLAEDGNYYYMNEDDEDDDDEDNEMSAPELLAQGNMYPSYANVSSYGS